MMRKSYEKPEINIIEFEEENDFITMSSVTDGNVLNYSTSLIEYGAE